MPHCEAGHLKITFWGVRGSIPSPGPRTVRYGGNTTCIEVETDEGELIILDAGSGILGLAQKLLKRLPVKCAIFFSHTHWDHIQGLPFFAPLFIPKNRIDIYGTFDPVSKRSIKEVLGRQMEYCYFPVREAELKAEILYTTLYERQTIEIGRTKVTSILMNHPVLNFGYLIEGNGKTVFFTGDYEPLYNIYHPDDDSFGEYARLISDQNASLVNFIENVDVLIVDAAYTADEYPLKRGWGHSTCDAGISLARMARAKSLYFTHHEQLRSDDELDAILIDLRKRYPIGPDFSPYNIAQEGLVIEL